MQKAMVGLSFCQRADKPGALHAKNQSQASWNAALRLDTVGGLSSPQLPATWSSAIRAQAARIHASHWQPMLLHPEKLLITTTRATATAMASAMASLMILAQTLDCLCLCTHTTMVPQRHWTHPRA